MPKAPLAPKEGPPRSVGDPLDQSGLVALLQRAAKAPAHPRKGRRVVTAIRWINPGRRSLCWCSKQSTCRTKPATVPMSWQASFRSCTWPRTASINCREIEQAQGRAARAEKWLTRIYQEIKLIHSRQ